MNKKVMIVTYSIVSFLIILSILLWITILVDHIRTKRFIKKYEKEDLIEEDMLVFRSNIRSCVSIMMSYKTNKGNINSTGSGFIIDKKNGLILTNYHVIATSNQIKNSSYKSNEVVIRFNDINGLAEGEILHIAPEYDMAIVKVDPEILKRYFNLLEDVVLDNRKVVDGEKVYSIGNAFGLAFKKDKDGIYAQSGIIMRIFISGRLINFIINYINIIKWKMKSLSLDNLINVIGLNYPGNSGCPVFDKNSHVLGVYNAGNSCNYTGTFIHSSKIIEMLERAKEKGLVIDYQTIESITEQFTFENLKKKDLNIQLKI